MAIRPAAGKITLLRLLQQVLLLVRLQLRRSQPAWQLSRLRVL
jgi:hypothetical protein